MLLLMQMWNAGGSLPNNKQILARMVRCSTKKWVAMSDIILEFFEVGDDRISHNRLTFERQKVEGKIEKRRAAGALGGKAKALKNKETGLAKAKAKGVAKPCHSPEPEPSTTDVVDNGGDLQTAFDAYVNVAKRLERERGSRVWPVNITFTKERKARLKARIREHGLDAWGTVLRKAAASPHCTGANGWAADFDFLTSKSGFLKTLEGNYDDRSANVQPLRRSGAAQSGGCSTAEDSFDRALASMAGDAPRSADPAWDDGFTIEGEVAIAAAGSGYR